MGDYSNGPTPPPPTTTTQPGETTTSGGGENTTPGGDYKVGLVGGSSANEGNVWATNSLGVYGVICDDGWDANAANVVCRQLGFSGAADVFDHSEFGDVDSDSFSLTRSHAVEARLTFKTALMTPTKTAMAEKRLELD